MIIRQYVNLHVETDVLNLDQTGADDNVWFANEKKFIPPNHEKIVNGL